MYARLSTEKRAQGEKENEKDKSTRARFYPERIRRDILKRKRRKDWKLTGSCIITLGSRAAQPL